MNIRRVASAKATEILSKKDLSSLSEKQREEIYQKEFLRQEKKIIKPAFGTLNKRIASLQSYTAKGNRKPSSLTALSYAGVSKFKTSGFKSELERQYSLAQRFYSSKSSTVQGAKEAEIRFEKYNELEDKVGKDISNAMWDAYNRLMETGMAGVVYSYGSYKLQEQIIDNLVKNNSFMDSLEGLDREEMVDAIYNMFTDRLSISEDTEDVYTTSGDIWKR